MVLDADVVPGDDAVRQHETGAGRHVDAFRGRAERVLVNRKLAGDDIAGPDPDSRSVRRMAVALDEVVDERSVAAGERQSTATGRSGPGVAGDHVVDQDVVETGALNDDTA